MSFLEYNYPLLDNLTQSPQGIRLASLRDLGAMKLAALAGRGAKKDFVDIHALVSSGITLSSMFVDYRLKYSTSDIAHLLFSLVYFDEADRQRMPRLLRKFDWRTIKLAMRNWAEELSRVDLD